MPADPAAIRLLALDVDGVLTDSSITYDDTGRELKTFNTRDGFGLKLWHESGGLTAIVTGRGGAPVRQRAKELGISIVLEQVKDKAAAGEQLAAQTGIPLAQTAYMGDDWPDLPLLARVGYPIAPADAEPPVLAASAWVAPRIGGRGAVRDAVEHLLTARGALAGLLARYHT